MYYRDKNGNKIDGKIIKENFTPSNNYKFIFVGIFILCIVLAVILTANNKLPKIIRNDIIPNDPLLILADGFVFGICGGILIYVIIITFFKKYFEPEN